MLKLDKYILKGFFASLGLSLLAIVGVYVFIDIFAKINEFEVANVRAMLSNLYRFYFYKTPLIVTQLFPIILMVSVMFLLIRLSKYNELSAITCAGISIYRVLLPVFVFTVVSSVGFFVLEEFFAPRLNERANKFELQLMGTTQSKKLMTSFEKYNFFFAGKIDLLTHELENVEVGYCNENFDRYMTYYAPTAKWDKENGVWLLNSDETAKVVVTSNPVPGMPKAPAAKQEFAQYTLPKSSELDPKHLAKISVKNTFPTIAQLNNLIKNYPHLADQSVYRQLKLQFHSRIASLFTVLILLGIGIYYVLQRGVKSFVVGIGMSLIVSMVFFILQLSLFYFVNKDKLSPEMAAWMPTVCFGLVAAFMMTKVRT